MFCFVTVLLLMLGLVIVVFVVDDYVCFVVDIYYKILDVFGSVDDFSKVEVWEFFFYGCFYCYFLELVVDVWLEEKLDYIDYVCILVFFLCNVELLVCVYYVEEVMGLVDQIYVLLFDVIYKYCEFLFSELVLVNFFCKYGVELEQFNKLYSLFGVFIKICQVDVLICIYKIFGVLNFVVNGKYLILCQNLKDNNELFQVIEYLVNKEKNGG